MLAGFELTPTAPLGEKQLPRDQESGRSYRMIPRVPAEGNERLLRRQLDRELGDTRGEQK